MAFDKEAFLAAFLERTAEGIDKRGAEADLYKQEQKAMAERNAATIQRRKATAQQAATLGRQLKNMGVSDAHIATAMSSGMSGIQDLYNKVNQAVSQRGVKRLGVDDIEAIVSMPAIPGILEQYQDMGIDQFAAQTYGAVGQASAAPEQASMAAKLFGFGGKASVDAQLREQQYADGMSYADINAAAKLADYQSLFSDATMTFTDIPAYGREEKAKFASSLTSAMTDAVYGTVGKAQVEAAAEGAATISEQDTLKQNKRLELQTKAALTYIEEQMSLYGEYAVLSDGPTARAIKDAIGVKALNELRRDNGMEDEIPEQDLKEEELLDKQNAGAGQDPEITKSEQITGKDPMADYIREKTGETGIGFVVIDGELRITQNIGDGGSFSKRTLSVEDTKRFFKENKERLEGITYETAKAQFVETTETAADEAAPMPKDLTDDQDNTNAKGEKIYTLNPDGTAPAYPEDNFMEGLLGSDALKKRRQKLWMKLFGKTHNPDGSLK